MKTHTNTLIDNKISIHTIKSAESIMYLKGDVNYTDIVYLGGKKNTIAHTLKRFEESSLFQDWLRIHRAYLVNPDYVTTVCYIDSTLQLKSGEILPISRRKLLNLREKKSFEMS